MYVSTKMLYVTFKCLIVPICKRSGKLFVLCRQMSRTTPLNRSRTSNRGLVTVAADCRNQTLWECSRNTTFVSSVGDAPGPDMAYTRTGNRGHTGYIGTGGRGPCGSLTCVVRSRLHGGCGRSRRHSDFPVQRPIMPRTG